MKTKFPNINVVLLQSVYFSSPWMGPFQTSEFHIYVAKQGA